MVQLDQYATAFVFLVCVVVLNKSESSQSLLEDFLFRPFIIAITHDFKCAWFGCQIFYRIAQLSEQYGESTLPILISHQCHCWGCN